MTNRESNKEAEKVFTYQRTFNAIAAAVEWKPHNSFGVSVAKFIEAFGPTSPVGQAIGWIENTEPMDPIYGPKVEWRDTDKISKPEFYRLPVYLHPREITDEMVERFCKVYEDNTFHRYDRDAIRAALTEALRAERPHPAAGG
jgi:hypothetical protein